LTYPTSKMYITEEIDTTTASAPLLQERSGEGKQSGEAKKIAIQGVRGAFHEIATRRYFGKNENVEVVEAMTFEDLIAMTQAGEVDGALMAIENTITGGIMNNFNLLDNSDLHIEGEIYLRIVQNLIVHPNVRIEDLTEVYSHPVALGQCVHFFKDYPHIKLISATDTALSVKMIKEKKMLHAGAVASSLAAEMYDMEILQASIEDYKQNYTRFLFLSPTLSFGEGERSVSPSPSERVGERTKCSIVFTLKHEVGSLHTVLAALAMYKANLTAIQSMPVLDEPWHYRFFVGFTFESPTHYELIMKALESLTERVKVLGVYEIGKYFEQ
jgi:prephenate dehydratase